MTRLNREQLDQVISERLVGQRIVRAETDEAEPDDAVLDADDFDRPAASLGDIRSKIAQYIDDSSPGFEALDEPLESATQFVIVEPDDDASADRAAPTQRAAVVSSVTNEIVAEQG